MQSISASTLLAAQQWRYATKQFDASKQIPADQWAALEQALVLTPSSFGLQPWRFVTVADPATRARLREVQRGLRSGIETLGARLALINIALVPLLLIVVALVIAVARRRRMARAQTLPA